LKLIVLGLDGASFELLAPWLEKGELPNLKKIKRRGVWGDMKSCLPPVSAPNWKCYSTGKNPGKLGIFWWENVDFKLQRVYCPDYRSESMEIWDYLNRAGIQTAVINMPMAYPPRKIDGYIAAGGPSAKEEGFTYPPAWEKELKRKGYRVHPSKSIFNREACEELFEEILWMMKQRFELAHELTAEKNVGFIHLTVFYINVLQHFLWDDNLVKKAWKVIDEEIGKLINLTEKAGWTLIMFSDHGSNKIEEVFNINTWLKKEGLLKTKHTLFSKVMYGASITRERVLGVVDTLGLKRVFQSAILEEILNRVPTNAGEVSREAKTGVVNWEKTVALGSGQGPLYLKPGKKAEETKEELAGRLEKLESPSTGRKPVRRVFRKEEVYSGEYLKKAPDLILEQAPHIHISGSIEKGEIFTKPDKWVADNNKIGLFFAIGADIQKCKRIRNISILDIAPTILHLFDLPIPSEMDGKVLKNIFREGSKPAKESVKYSRIKEKLKRKIEVLKKMGKI
jgi:predicted AlkP superfamily phosphohydrolase/phosphomutase